MAELLADFHTLQLYIAAAPCNPPDMDDYYTEGWAALRQCAIDGQHILNCAADVTVPSAAGGPEEQDKAELKQCVFSLFILFFSFRFSCVDDRCFCLLFQLTPFSYHRIYLDAYARRHDGQKIYLRQAAAQRWVEWRDQILMGGRPHSGNQAQLRAVDQQLRNVSLLPRSLLRSLPPLSLSRGIPPRLLSRHPTDNIPFQELATITDEAIYAELQASDMSMGRWTAEDPSLRAVLRWLRTRRR